MVTVVPVYGGGRENGGTGSDIEMGLVKSEKGTSKNDVKIMNVE